MAEITEAIKTRAEEQRQQLAKLPRIREELQARIAPNQARVEELQEGMADLLAAVALGEAEPAEVERARSEIAQRLDENADIGLALQGLSKRDRQLEIATGSRRVGAMLREAAVMEELMGDIRCGRTAKAHRLPGYAQRLGVEDAVEAFTAEMAAKGVSW